MNVGLGEQARPDPRAFVAHISANQGDLYDFLAEEVIASLATDLHAFLTRVSVLTWVDVAIGRAWYARWIRTEILQAIRDAEDLGLLAQPDRESPHRFHPLVRAFLLAQLEAEIGENAVRAIHERVGRRSGIDRLGNRSLAPTRGGRSDGRGRKSLTARSTRYLRRANSNERDHSSTAPLAASIVPEH